VYADSAATQVCASIAPGVPTTLYVVATLDETLARGIKGAEFRLEITQPRGWFVNYTPPVGAIYVGNPIDDDDAPCTGAGVIVAFGACRRPDVSGDKVLLGQLLVTHVGGAPTQILVKRHISPGNPTYRCPLLIECNEPRNEKHCIEPALHTVCGDANLLRAGPPGHDAAFFVTALNEPLDANSVAFPERHVERELILRAGSHVLRVPTGGALVPLADAAVASDALRGTLETLKVVAVGAAFPDCGSSECATTAERQWCAGVADVALLRFNHARTARRALRELERVDAVDFVLPATEFLVPLETTFRMQTTLTDGMQMRADTRFRISVSKPVQLRLELLDVTGRSVGVLRGDFLAAGEHEVEWGSMLRDERERSTGLFQLAIEAGGQKATFKVVIVGE